MIGREGWGGSEGKAAAECVYCAGLVLNTTTLKNGFDARSV
jgi:hypothetical protein